MHIVENKSKHKNKIYNSILLRESYREDGKVKKRTIANLSHCSTEEIAAIKFALKNKNNIKMFANTQNGVQLIEGPIVGSVWTVYEISKRLGIEDALGKDFNGQLALWQVISRVIRQGSRLAAVRLAQTHAADEIINFARGFNEDNLYDNLKWMSENQETIEDNLFKIRHGNAKPQIFLYDVTSSYLEGDKNYFGKYGYNRDGKKAKKQIVVGLLCDEHGEPVSTEVFFGNTQDPKTFFSQVKKAAERFKCKKVTFVGDRGMIKSAQIESLKDNFYHITAITKPQIESLMKKGVFQLSLFDKEICEIVDQDTRYVLRRNPERADQIMVTRISKKEILAKKCSEKNLYLKEHPKAKVTTAVNELNKKIESLKVSKWISVEVKERHLSINIDDNVLEEESRLDGCYVIKSNLPSELVCPFGKRA